MAAEKELWAGKNQRRGRNHIERTQEKFLLELISGCPEVI